MTQRRLGRGLDSLISPSTGSRTADLPTATQEPLPHPVEEAHEPAAAAILSEPKPPAGVPMDLAVSAIDPNPYQPRKDFDEAPLQELMQSIASNGIIQPLVVRPKPGGRYELVAGERRLRAAEALGLATIPAVIRDVPEERMLELALIENIQREDLNPIEKAAAFRDYLQRYHLTQDAAAQRMGLDRATIANHLRLLELPQDIQVLVRKSAISMSHARTIAALSDPAQQLTMAKKVIRQGLSVRQLERAVAQLQSTRQRARAASAANSAQAVAIEEELRRLFGTRVRIHEGPRKGTGSIVIEYYTLDDFDRIMSVIRR